MNKEVVAEGIRRFAENVGAKISQEGDILFQATFPDERYPTFIGIECFGLVLSYATPCGVVPDTKLAPTLLMRNWGGVEDTCFYFSVNVEEGDAWSNLETRQFLDRNSTSDDISSLLGRWRRQCMQAKEALKH